ncbi:MULTISPECIES: 16S rRNA (uracil(1498)-N(3))-methyltransferase [Corynebacterium]|uniref:16S rRNA (uracil(1498)-N(3))-methyltransferase n=1 Tax=Corynebacterium TaxID=1716 RepID=UPI00195D9989|nr:MULTISPECIES: 16S rRNA (uracil(1498)-N(3))-methyltransferase [Corynebacterium]MDN8623815.1 16S rRNA (uracil(1498)-N(3))-methyltransferase [Corynebacterium kroppenstedtii]QRQ64358.1 16S rRNA (uracil(1498)-N(3))-methyltransferase [Corynebacterium kroppenstedtii]
MSDPVFVYGFVGYPDGVFPPLAGIIGHRDDSNSQPDGQLGGDTNIHQQKPLTQYDVGDVVLLSGPEGRHAVTVKRLVPGDALVLVNGEGNWLRCTVESTPSKTQLRATVLEAGYTTMPTPPITVVQALPKSDRSELAVDLACQAGADAIAPWSASRSIARWKGKERKAGTKWADTAVASSKQSRRARFPRIAALSTTDDVVNAIEQVTQSGGCALVLEESESVPVTALSDTLRQASHIILIVGPEGGIAPDEHDAFVRAGATSVVLGPEVLRTATAASVALGSVNVLAGRWSTA